MSIGKRKEPRGNARAGKAYLRFVPRDFCISFLVNFAENSYIITANDIETKRFDLYARVSGEDTFDRLVQDHVAHLVESAQSTDDIPSIVSDDIDSLVHVIEKKMLPARWPTVRFAPAGFLPGHL